MLSLASMLDDVNGSYLFNLFNEYEEHKTKEANFVKSLDLFDMYLQAYEYEKLHTDLDLSDFFSKIPNDLLETNGHDDIIKSCLKELLEIRNKKLNCLPFDSNLNTILKNRLVK